MLTAARVKPKKLDRDISFQEFIGRLEYDSLHA